jgi:hypothetical protein
MKLVEPRIAEVVLFWEVLKLDQSTLVQRVECSAHILSAAGRVAAQSHGKLAGAHQWIAAAALECGEDLALFVA